jgi:hypothetical protein
MCVVSIDFLFPSIMYCNNISLISLVDKFLTIIKKKILMILKQYLKLKNDNIQIQMINIIQFSASNRAPYN